MNLTSRLAVYFLHRTPGAKLGGIMSELGGNYYWIGIAYRWCYLGVMFRIKREEPQQ